MVSKLLLVVLFVASFEKCCGQLPGGWTSANVNSTEVVNAAKKALGLYDAPNSKNLVVMDILNASQQVVAGMNYKLKVKVGLSTCARNENFNRACFLDATGTCDFEIYAQAWESYYNLTSSTCGNTTSSWKRVQTNNIIVTNSITSALRLITKHGLTKMLTLGRIQKVFENLEMPGVYKVNVIIRSKCPPCVSANQQFTASRAQIFLSANLTNGHLMDCRTDSPILISLTRCLPFLHPL